MSALVIQRTDGAVQGKHGAWTCPECGAEHSIPRFTAFLSVVKCVGNCGSAYDLQNWDNPYEVSR